MEREDRDPLDIVAEDFAERCRRGETPAITDYIQQHPDLAEELRELLPTVAAMERAKRGRPSPKPPVAARIPDRIGDYRLVREIGRGGMGVVYEAEQESLRRRVALKLLPQQFLTQAKRLERFRREARAAAQLHHTNIVPVFGVGEDAGYSYYVMQLIEGRGLDNVIRTLRTGRMKRETMDESPATVTHLSQSRAAESSSDVTPPPIIVASNSNVDAIQPPSMTSTSQLHPSGGNYFRDVAELGRQIASALAYAHEQGTLHRDIKPANILLDRQGVAWLTDFGLAKLTEDEDLTKTGDLIGTLHYMAPEVLQHGKADGRSDLYSLGLTLYEALTLRLPFTETQPARIVKQITESAPPRPREVNPQIPADLETIVLTAIAREPRHRYASARALADDLLNFLEGRPIRARRMTSLELAWRWCLRNRLTAALIATAAASLLLAAIVGWVGYGSTNAALARESKRRSEAEDANKKAVDEQRRGDANVELSLQTLEAMFRQLASDESSARYTALSKTVKEIASLNGRENLDRGLPPREGPPPRDGRPPREAGLPVFTRSQQEEKVSSDRDAAQAALLGIILDFYEKFAEMNRTDDKLHAEAIAAYRHMGDIYRRQRETGKVEERISRVIKKLEESVQDIDINEATRYALADLYLMIAAPTENKQDSTQAAVIVERLTRALSIANRLVAESPQNDEYKMLQARATARLALVEQGRSSVQQDKAKKLFEQLAQQFWPTTRQTVVSIEELADLRLIYAEYLCQTKQWAEARAFLKRSEKDLDQKAHDLRSNAIATTNPTLRPTPEFHNYMTSHFKLLADACEQLGDPEAAHFRDRSQQGPPDRQPPGKRSPPAPRF